MVGGGGIMGAGGDMVWTDRGNKSSIRTSMCRRGVWGRRGRHGGVNSGASKKRRGSDSITI